MHCAYRKRLQRRIAWTNATMFAIVIAYFAGYALTFWLAGRGTVGLYNAIRIESTAYWPLQQYRLSSLPGSTRLKDFRAWCFDAGQESWR